VKTLDLRGLEIACISTGDTVFDFDVTDMGILIGSRNRPIHLVHAFSGAIRGSYTAYSNTEEIIHPYSVRSDGTSSIIGGFAGSTIRIWDMQRPGRQMHALQFSTRKQTGNLKGIVGAVNYWNSPDTILAGTYSGMLGMFDSREMSRCVLFGSPVTLGGVVQISKISDRNLIISGHRNSKESLLIWDMRKPDTPVFTVDRPFQTQQRSSFGIWKNRFICYGNDGGNFSVFDLDTGTVVVDMKVSNQPTAAVDVCESGRVVVGSGQRRFSNVGESSDDETQRMIESPQLDLFQLVFS
jgi:WD40 repeat protein